MPGGSPREQDDDRLRLIPARRLGGFVTADTVEDGRLGLTLNQRSLADRGSDGTV